MPPKVRDVIRLLEREGWYLERTSGSHRHYKNATRSATVTVAGKLSDDMKIGTWKSIQRQAELPRARST